MPKVGLTPDQKSRSIFDVDKFAMKSGQKARVLVIEEEFLTEFVHWVDGQGYFICTGDYSKMLHEQYSPTCKFCEAAQASSAVSQAKRKFVTLLVVYRTNSKGALIEPVSAEVVPWIFGNDKFNDLISKKEQWGDLRKHDLMIECLGEQFQKMRIDILPDAVWQSDATAKAAVATALKEAMQQYGKELSRLLGRDINDPERVAEILSDATGIGVTPDYAQSGDISAMFDDPATTTEVPTVDFNDLLEGTQTAADEEDGDEEAVVEEPKPKAKPKAKAKAKAEVAAADPLAEEGETVPAGDVDFDDLLGI